MQSRIGCICTLFQMFSKIACLNRWRSQRLHLYAFFNCLLKLSARKDAKSHWLHFYTFSPEGVFKCFLKLPAWTDGKSHWLHLNDFSPEGVFKCFLKSPAWIDAKLQMVAFVRFFNCLLKLSAWTDAKSHWLHLYAFLQSEFSNLSSNCLQVQMQSHIGCICMLFQMSLQIVCPNRCKVALVAFVRFFT